LGVAGLDWKTRCFVSDAAVAGGAPDFFDARAFAVAG